MTTRPELTDEIVLTVRSDYDLFLRGDVFDRWDGTRWSKSSTDRYALLGGDRVTTSPIDLGATGADVVAQTIRVEAGYADVFFATPTAVAVDSRLPVVQTLDGTLLTRRGGMGRGETYTVTSRRIPLDEGVLRSVEGKPFPASVTRVYAEDPVATDRVRALADRIVTSSGATTTYDRIRAIEGWMDDNLEYSIDAPTSPKGSDVVDDFLFRSKLGWCEQIASSLVVMARSQGIPARLATGYVMDERDPVTGRYVVRARNAHAWAEVWFPELGWVPFDPTAGVPLALERPSDDTLADWILRHLVEILVGTAVVVVLAVVGRRVVGRVLARRRDRPRTWAAEADRRLTRLGEARGVARSPGDTAAAYARRLAASESEGADDIDGGPDLVAVDLVAVGQVVDDHLFAPVPPSPDDIARAEAVLAAAESPPAPPS
jgi:transglutaminase-like putative cysteine protease